MRRLTAWSAAAAMAAAAASALAADPPGRAKAERLCGNCHAVDGTGLLPGAANLGGQQQEYLREQLRAFRAGSRQNPQMTYVAKTLSDADIDDLAAWYASIKVVLTLPE